MFSDKFFSKRTVSMACFLPLVLFFTGCKKQIIEVIPAIGYESISVASQHDVVEISFPGVNTGYIGCQTETERTFENEFENAYYKTTNGGKTWVELTVPGGSNVEVRNVCFPNDSMGLIVNGKNICFTKNGGSTWSVVSDDGICADIDASGNLYYTERSGLWNVLIFKYNFTYNIFTYYATLYVEESNKTGGRICGSYLYILTTNDYDNGFIHGYNLVTKTVDDIGFGSLSSGEDIMDIVSAGESFAIAAKRGNIIAKGINDTYGQVYLQHHYDYYSVDCNNDYFVAVGNKTISSNVTGEWQEVFDLNGDGFSHTFYTVRFCSDKEFYIGGNNGLIWKGTLE